MATGERNQYVSSDQVGLMYVEPANEPSKNPIIDSLTRKMAAALNASKETSGYMGVHTCSCGVRSDNRVHVVELGGSLHDFSTNSLAVHYLAYHRAEVPQRELDKVAALYEEADPTAEQLAFPPPPEGKVRPESRQEFLARINKK